MTIIDNATGTTVRTVNHFINGNETGQDTSDYTDRRAPGTDEVITRILRGTSSDVQHAIETARRAFDDGRWPNTTGFERARILNRLGDLIDRDAAILAKIDSEETGKPIRVAEGDIAGAADLCRYAASLAITMQGSSFTNNGPDYTGIIIREPVGVVGLIVPWNFPALILCQKLPFALAAGCTAVIKASEFTSSSALHIVKLCIEAGVPDGVVNFVAGGGSIGAAIAESPLIDLVSFTGSTPTGQKVMAAAAGNMKKASLELGGKAAAIVFDDADIEDALAGVMFGIVFNNGECCVSQPRLLVQDTIADDFVQELSRKFATLRVGQPLDRATDVGALIHAAHLNSVTGYIDGSADSGAEIAFGGKRLTGGEYGNGQFVQPTVIDRVDKTAPVFVEEIFGPVLTVTRFTDGNQAVELANAVEYGLSNSVWSKNIDRVLETAKRLQSGTVYANTVIDAPPTMPFGGYKASGIGREMGQAGFEEYTELKSVNIRTGKRAGKFLISGSAIDTLTAS